MAENDYLISEGGNNCTDRLEQQVESLRAELDHLKAQKENSDALIRKIQALIDARGLPDRSSEFDVLDSSVQQVISEREELQAVIDASESTNAVNQLVMAMNKRVNDLIAERDELQKQLDARWQPIETAPKDGGASSRVAGDSTMTTKEQAQEMLERAEKATSGPWETRTNIPYTHNGIVIFSGRWSENKTIGRWGNVDCMNTRNDVDFITAARTDLPELARSYLALQSRVEALEGALNGLMDAVNADQSQLDKCSNFDRAYAKANAALHPEIKETKD